MRPPPPGCPQGLLEDVLKRLAGKGGPPVLELLTPLAAATPPQQQSPDPSESQVNRIFDPLAKVIAKGIAQGDAPQVVAVFQLPEALGITLEVDPRVELASGEDLPPLGVFAVHLGPVNTRNMSSDICNGSIAP